MHCAARAGDLEGLELIMQFAPNRINEATGYGETPLFLASWKSRQDAVGLLVNARAAVNQANKAGHTPLYAAGNERVKQLLRTAGGCF